MNDSHSELILTWFTELEDRLCQVLKTIPLSSATESVFVPSLSGIILEACSLVDTVFRTDYPAAKRHAAKFKDFAAYYEPTLELSERYIVAFQHPLRSFRPYEDWNTKQLDWWNKYNKVKHDRLNNYECSNLLTSLYAVAGLFQAIASSSYFVDSLLRHNMMHFGDWSVQLALKVLKGPPQAAAEEGVTVLVESELFAMPVGAYRFPPEPSDIEGYRAQFGDKLWRYLRNKW